MENVGMEDEKLDNSLFKPSYINHFTPLIMENGRMENVGMEDEELESSNHLT